MWLDALDLHHVRNMVHARLDGCAQFNVICGDNGSGKTTLLEAIHVLSTGRSFRSAQLRPVIQRGQTQLVVTGQCAHHHLGVLRTLQGEPQNRLDGVGVRQSQLTRLLPVQVFEPSTTDDLLHHGSLPRRQALDWLLFHVEPTYHTLWGHHQRALQQRNALLRTHRVGAELESWDQQLADSGEQVHAMRAHHLQHWQVAFTEVMAVLLPNQPVELHGVAGFDTRVGLLADLQRHHASDLERGYSGRGVHRAGFALKTPLGLAEHVLSRGQKKLTILGLKLSQLILLERQQVRCVVLLDDVEAELDPLAQTRLWQVISATNSQVFITALSADRLMAPRSGLLQPRMFHVKHGEVS